MSSSATKVDSCSSGSTIGSVFEDWLEKPWMRIVHTIMCLTDVVLYLYGVVSLIWKIPPCAFWIRCHWSRLSPSSGVTLGYTWQGMVSQRLATGWWKCQTPSGLCSGCLPPWTRRHPRGLGPLLSGYELNRTYLGRIGRGLEELVPQAVNLRQLRDVVQNLWQQIPLERIQTLVSSMPRRVRALVDTRGSSTRYWTVDTLGLT